MKQNKPTNTTNDALPNTGMDVFEQKENAVKDNAKGHIHYSGQDSIYYSDSYLIDCDPQRRIYCYINKGSEWAPEQAAIAYFGAGDEHELWRLEDDAVHDVAIDKNGKYAAASASQGVYIVEARPRRYHCYPDDAPLLAPEDWPVLRRVEEEYCFSLAFDGEGLLHMRNGQRGVGSVLDIERLLVWDEGRSE